jgi:hypothetical protein
MTLRMKSDDCLFLMIDIQQKLAPAMLNGEEAIALNYKLLQAVQKLGLPYIVSEQYSKGIGHTVDLLAPLIDPQNTFEKISFSCLAEPRLKKAIQETKRKQVVVSGMESHVCVLQTVLDLIEEGYHVFVVENAVSSRTFENKISALERMRQAGAQIVTFEMVVFEWLERAGNENFKSLLPLIK